MPPSNLREYISGLTENIADTLTKIYGLDDVPEIEPTAWTKWAQTVSESAISIEDFNVAVKEIEAFIKDDNKEVENIPEVSWEEMMQIKTEEQNND